MAALIKASASGESGDGSVGSWREAFLRAPYLRDTFIAMGVLAETFETAITWERFESFHAAVMDRVGELLIPGSSLVISDEGLGRETGRGTEFIVLTR